RAVPDEDHVPREVDLTQVRKVAIVGFDHPGVGQPQLLPHIRDPALAETLPREQVDTTLAQKGPHRELYRPGIGGGNDGDAIIGRNVEERSRSVDHFLEPCLAGSGTMRPADERVPENFGSPAGALRAGAGGETGIVWPHGWLHRGPP